MFYIHIWSNRWKPTAFFIEYDSARKHKPS